MRWKCPNCGYHIAPPPSEFREFLRKYADGTKTSKQLAELTGKTTTTVATTINDMRKKGENVSLLIIDTRRSWEQTHGWYLERKNGLTISELARREKISAGRMQQILQKIDRTLRYKNDRN